MQGNKKLLQNEGDCVYNNEILRLPREESESWLYEHGRKWRRTRPVQRTDAPEQAIARIDDGGFLLGLCRLRVSVRK